MYIHQLQIESSSPGSVRGIYGTESADGDLETGEASEIIIVGQGIPDKVLCLPLTKEFTKKLVMTEASIGATYRADPAQNEVERFQSESLGPVHALYPGAMGVYLEETNGALSIHEQALGLGAAKGFSLNQNPEDAIMRLVMRHPKEDILADICRMHEKLKEILTPFIGLDDSASLKWLLEQTIDDSRGGFKNVESLIDYLRKPSAEMSSSELITKTATIIISLSYSWLDCGEPTTEGLRDDENRANIVKHGRLLDALRPVINGHIVPHIGLIYPGRYDQCLKTILMLLRLQ